MKVIVFFYICSSSIFNLNSKAMTKKNLLKLAVCGFVVSNTIVVTVFATQQKDPTHALLMKNIEALTDVKSEEGNKTCYHINVWASDAPLQLSCSTCTYRYGYGQPGKGCQ